jgi:twitching motility protein PilT
MAKLDAYLRSMEKLGASGAVLVSGQAVTLKFPTGDRNATQVTPHDQLVAMVREVAPAAALDQIDRQRVARFDFDRYTVDVAPRQGAWIVSIVPTQAVANLQTQAIPRAAAAPMPRPPTPPPVAMDIQIERGQYDQPAEPAARQAASASAFLDQITQAARGARASDVYLGAGARPLMRVGGELSEVGSPIDGDLMARELGVVAPPEARGAWADGGSAVFAYGDGGGRVRVTLGRDQRGPAAALRLLPDEPPALDRLGLTNIDSWLIGHGLLAIAGESSAGKTLTLAALVRAVAAHHRRVVTLEEPIELVHASTWISQRAVGMHVASFSAGARAAMHEGVDAIAIATVASADAAEAVVDAVAGGHLVIACVIAGSAGAAIERIVDRIAGERRDAARVMLVEALLGVIRPVVARGGARTFEVVAGR